MRDGGFNASHWMFAYQYLLSAVEMDYVFQRDEMPTENKKRWNQIYWAVMILNIVDIFAYDGILLYVNITEIHCACDPLGSSVLLFWAYTVSRYMVGLLQIVSGIILLVAVYKVRSFLVKVGMANQVNYTSMTIHAVSFGLYNVSVVVFYYAFFSYQY